MTASRPSSGRRRLQPPTSRAHAATLCVLQVTGLTPEAEEAQEYLMKLPTRFNKLAQRQAKSLAKKPREPKEWAWINGRVI